MEGALQTVSRLLLEFLLFVSDGCGQEVRPLFGQQELLLEDGFGGDEVVWSSERTAAVGERLVAGLALVQVAVCRVFLDVAVGFAEVFGELD